MAALRSASARMCCLVSMFVLLGQASLRAQGGPDRLLSNVIVAEQNGCTVVKVDFNSRIQYQSHFPATGGDELKIQVNPMDRAAGDRKPLSGSESLRAPSSERASIHAIELDTSGQAATLTVFFRRTVAYKVAQGIDFKSVIIAISGPASSTTCLPVMPVSDQSANAAGADQPSIVSRSKGAVPSTGPLSSAQLDTMLSEARAAIEKSNADRAVQLLTKIVEAGDTKQRPEALELLGAAREQRGQLSHARAEYQDYLKLYPSGAGAARVRQRLAAMESSAQSAAAAGTTLAQGQSGEPSARKIKLGGDGAAKAPAQSGYGTHLPEAPKSPSEWSVTQYGSLSSYYNLNQGGRGFIEAPRTNVGWDKEDPYKTYQNSILSNFDYDARFDNAAYAGRLKFSASQQNNLMQGGRNEARISALYLDGRIKDAGVTTRIGRQTGTSGGVLGRFDGGVASYQALQNGKVFVLAGSPVERSADIPFANQHRFYGAGTEFSFLNKSLELGGYIIEQRAEGLVDRQAVGTELRYVKDGTATYGTIEYDTHFGQLNSVAGTANKVFDDQSAASINLDYRRAPILLATNALQGQGVFTLRELLQRYSTGEIDRLALDRTAQSYTATASYSRPINAKLQWLSDATVTHLTGMPASGGVEAVPTIGTDYYLATQLIASGLWREGDNVSAGLRYANTPTSDRYMVELGMTYPINLDWRVNPMLRFGYSTYKTDSRIEYQVMPTIRTSYALRRDVQLELEVGGKLGITNSSDSREYQNELLFLAGVRYDFTSVK
jgi:hypothetical protein